MPEMTSEDLNSLASSALKRRTHLSCENFKQFFDDVNAVCFVETVEKDEEISFECSCAVGLKGIGQSELTFSRLIYVSCLGNTNCVHKLALELKAGIREPVNRTPVSTSVRKPGKPKKSAIQRR